MKPPDSDDPYAPPASEPLSQPLLLSLSKENGEVRWRVVEGRLLVRVGAVLPDVCLVSGAAGLPGFRRRMEFQPPSLTGIFRPRGGITVFESRGTFLKAWSLLIGMPVLGVVAGVISSLVMVGDDSATPTSISVSFTLMGLGALIPLWRLRKAPAIGPAEADGWHEVRNVHPVAINGLRMVQTTRAPGTDLP